MVEAVVIGATVVTVEAFVTVETTGTVDMITLSRLYDSINRLTCEPGKKAACLHEGDYAAGHAIMHVQMHVQLTMYAVCYP